MTLKERVGKSLGEGALFDEPMARHTSFRIGGPADVYLEPATEDDAALAVRWCFTNGVPLTVLGNGTNVLVSDKGVRGVVMVLGRRLADISVEGTVLTAGCGAPLTKVAAAATRAGLSGMEFAEGIPGTLGGAIYMNAGTLLGEVKDCLLDVRAVTREGTLVSRTLEELDMTYRCSGISRSREILLSARFGLHPSDSGRVRSVMSELRDRRHNSQPHWDRSAGCVFKNPDGGMSAGRLLDEAGAKGMKVGGAVVSDRHANFVVNAEDATANDVVDLMGRMRELIQSRIGITLIPEVEFVGDWPEAPLK